MDFVVFSASAPIATYWPLLHENTRPPSSSILHLTLDILQQLLQLPLIRLLGRPTYPQPLTLIWLGNQVKVHMIHHLVRNPAVVLQDVVILDALRERNLLRHREHFAELVVGDVVELCAVEFGDDELDAG